MKNQVTDIKLSGKELKWTPATARGKVGLQLIIKLPVAVIGGMTLSRD